MTISNLDKLNTNKISKYIIRLRKSIKNNKHEKTLEYYDHFKYHVQLGGKINSNDKNNNMIQLTESLNSIDTIISNITKNETTNNNLENDLKKCNIDKIELVKQITNLNDELNELKLKLSETIKQNEKIDKIKTKQNEEILSLNTKIDKLNEETIKLKDWIKKIETEKNTSDSKLKTIKESLLSFFNISGDVEINLDKELNNVREKISKYENIIKHILSKTENVNLNETGELEKYETALLNIKIRSENATKLENELESIKKQNEELSKHIKYVDEITKDLELKNLDIEKFKNTITSKDNEIKLLSTQLEEYKKKINELENIIDDKSNQIDKIALEFDIKIKELLKKIYNDNTDLINKIISGTKLSNSNSNSNSN